MTPQHLVALDKANAHRLARAEFRRTCKHDTKETGATRMTELLTSPPVWALSWPVTHALIVVPNLGPSKISDACRHAGVGQFTTVGSLTVRQRASLVDRLWRA